MSTPYTDAALTEFHKTRLASAPRPLDGWATARRLEHALAESVKLQSHYAELLNMHDGGQRMTFTPETWMERLAR